MTERLTMAADPEAWAPKQRARAAAHASAPRDRRASGSLLSWLTVLLMWLCWCRSAEASRCVKFSKNNMTEPPPKYVYDKSEQLQVPLTLDTSQRLSHQLTTAVVKILLEEGLGYQNVTIIRYEEDSFNSEIALSRLKSPYKHKSKPPRAMINLEVWLPPRFLEEDNIVKMDCGSHASGSRFGWYISNNSYTQTEQIMDHWRSFQRVDVVRIFELTAEEDTTLQRDFTKSGDKYFCKHPNCTDGIFTPPICREGPCATLLVGDYNDFSAFLVDQVMDQHLRVRVAWIGPNLNHQFLCTFRSPKPLMFFDWWPNQLSNLEEFMPVSFPPCSSYKGMNSSYLCNYELHSLKKMIWRNLPETAKVAVELVKRFYLSEEDYRELLSLYTNMTSTCGRNASLITKPQSEIIEDVACQWLQRSHSNGTEVWVDWLPHDYAAKTVLWIGGIFPVNSKKNNGFTSATLLRAAYMATDRVNNNSEILQDYDIKLMVQNGGCKSEYVLASFIHYVRSETGSPPLEQMIGILGPACSDTVEPLAGVAKHFYTVVLSYSAEGAIFNDREKYPYFFRTIPENKMYGFVYSELFKVFEWKQVASLTEDCNKYSEYLTLLQNMLPKGVNLVNRKFPRAANRNMTDHLLKLKDKNLKIIIADFYAGTAREVLCEAYHLNMTAKYDYVWFLPRWFASNWYDTEYYAKDDAKKIPCNKSMMIEAVDRHMALGYAYYAHDDFRYHEGKTVGEWREEYKAVYLNHSQSLTADYAGYTYDAVWTYAFALDKLLKEDETHVSNLHSSRTNKRFVEIISQTEFDGVSGHINFKDGPSRDATINIMQYVFNYDTMTGQYKTVGTFTSNDSQKKILNLNKDNLHFVNGIPTDGSLPNSCLFETFRQILDVRCEVAIVIVMVLIFAVFAMILIGLFIVYKKRFEKMLPEQPAWPLGELMSLDEWELPREKVVINRTIGEGAFGTVFGGECQFGENSPWLAVAVKTLKVGSTVEEKLDFLGEAEMMKRFTHVNVVQLLGLCTHQEPIYMVMEFMLYGDLKTYLLARRHLVSDKTVHSEEDEISSRRLTSMALDVCRALAYLAENRYVHRDVACRNCLVSAERIVKLSDFGMTRPMYESEYYRFNRRAMLPVRWMSPESIEDGLFTNMSDMWSYGVLLYEIITFGSFPFQGMSNNQVVEHVRAGNTITIPSGVKPQLERLLMSCWSKSPQDRPTFNEMAETLTMWPRLITPCLEVPSAAVQLNDTDSLEIVLPAADQPCRRSSAPTARLPNPRVRHTSGGDNIPASSNVQGNLLSRGLNVPLLSTTSTPAPPTTLNVSSWNRAPQENGGGPSVEPLLPQNGDGYMSRYVCLQRTKSGENNSDLDSPYNKDLYLDSPNMTAV
ncbi:atrial natriuretic peptide receptor 2-like isoform X2 [Penaeus chinensis]|nr:atrial natriuretic peptide receptor 2-like isoform X2 [Penaeus chinensis]XP_047475228.1 atrial natriuretic peptide receptor 2-like isoform X2 [Penaeus chinensis]XP_047475229.1 atrial natriuretic peptide receptor 2-like isoform X2 [Penaeus chinensis]